MQCSINSSCGARRPSLKVVYELKTTLFGAMIILYENHTHLSHCAHQSARTKEVNKFYVEKFSRKSTREAEKYRIRKNSRATSTTVITESVYFRLSRLFSLKTLRRKVVPLFRTSRLMCSMPKLVRDFSRFRIAPKSVVLSSYTTFNAQSVRTLLVRSQCALC